MYFITIHIKWTLCLFSTSSTPAGSPASHLNHWCQQPSSKLGHTNPKTLQTEKKHPQDTFFQGILHLVHTAVKWFCLC